MLCAQLSVTLSVVNAVYKAGVVWTAISLHFAFSKRDKLIEQMELEAGLGGGTTAATTSSGEAQDPRSLSAKDGR